MGRSQSRPRSPPPCSKTFTKASNPCPPHTSKPFAKAFGRRWSATPTVFLIGEDIGIYGGAFKVTAGFFEHFGEKRVVDNAHLRSRHRRSRHRCRAHGTSSRGRNAVRRLHHLRFRPDRELRRQVAVNRWGARRPHGGAGTLRRRHPWRPVPLTESRDVVRAHARPQSRGAVHCVRCQRLDQIGHPRQRPP